MTISAVVAAAAVILGILPARLLAFGGRGSGLLLALLLAPLLLPRYLTYYAWSLLLNMNSPIGRWLMHDIARSQAFGLGISVLVLLLWQWPLASMMIARGWRRVDDQVWQAARLEANPLSRWRHVALPMMLPALALTACVCFMLALSESTTFELAGTRTIGNELERLYLESGSSQAVALAAWPSVAVSLLVAIGLWRRIRLWSVEPALSHITPPRAAVWFTAGMLVISIGGPVALLAVNLQSLSPLWRFWTLHRQELTGSLIVSGVAAAAALVMAGATVAAASGRKTSRILAGGMSITILLALLVPGCILAAALVELSAGLSLPVVVRESWLNVSAGQAARLAGVALLVLYLGRDAQDRHLSEMAALDGASPAQTWLHVHWPRIWPWVVASGLLVGLLGMMEVSASLVLLPAGAPSFARWLLNQMHYAWEQDVIIGCLVLIAAYAVLAAATLILVGIGKRRWAVVPAVLLVTCLPAAISGCNSAEGSGAAQKPHVIACIGRTGKGQGEFIYPRGISLAADGSMWVADRTGRVQHLTAEGRYINEICTPETTAGYPVGVKVSPDGDIYIADTHYHRVLAYHSNGQFVRQIGSAGEGPGQFIFPTDVAIAPDGRIYVSEYSGSGGGEGSDRISVFSPSGEFLFSFGRRGEGPGQFSRPAALAIDAKRNLLYVADEVNHRVVVCDLEGRRLSEFGKLGQQPGELRYPSGVAVLPDGTIVVVEKGNNRIQFFDPQGKSLRILGQGGRARASWPILGAWRPIVAAAPISPRPSIIACRYGNDPGQRAVPFRPASLAVRKHAGIAHGLDGLAESGAAWLCAQDHRDRAARFGSIPAGGAPGQAHAQPQARTHHGGGHRGPQLLRAPTVGGCCRCLHGQGAGAQRPGGSAGRGTRGRRRGDCQNALGR